MLSNDSVQPQSYSAQSADVQAVGDALECLLHIVHTSNEGHIVTLQSDGLLAVAQALQVSADSLHLSFPVLHCQLVCTGSLKQSLKHQSDSACYQSCYAVSSV